jgi:PadR family transcriptional regulator, regulatory protein PadR
MIMETKQINEIVVKMKQEMMRGLTVAFVMKFLDSAQYGYALQKELNDRGLEIGQDTLYPMLRRLEDQGLLESEWRGEDPRPRRYYRLNQDGQLVLEKLKTELELMEQITRRVVYGNE